MIHESRTIVRLVWNGIVTDWFILLVLTFAVLAGVTGILQPNESNTIVMTIPIFWAFGIFGRVMSAERLRPIIVLPVSSRGVATACWLLANMFYPALYAIALLLASGFQLSTKGALPAHFPRMIGFADAMLLCFSLLYMAWLGLLKTQGVRIFASDILSNFVISVPLLLMFGFAFFSLLHWDGIVQAFPPLLAVGPILAIANYYLTPVCIPFGAVSIRAASASTPRASSRPMPVLNTTRFRSILMIYATFFRMTLLCGFMVLGGGILFHRAIGLPILDLFSKGRSGSPPIQMMAGFLFFVLPNALFVYLHWLSALRAFRALPLTSQGLVWASGVCALASALGIGVLLALAGIPAGLIDAPSFVIHVLGIAAILWLSMAIATALGNGSIGLFAGLMPLIWIGFIQGGNFTIRRDIGIFICLIAGALAWFIFSRLIHSSRAYHLLPIGKPAPMR